MICLAVFGCKVILRAHLQCKCNCPLKYIQKQVNTFLLHGSCSIGSVSYVDRLVVLSSPLQMMTLIVSWRPRKQFLLLRRPNQLPQFKQPCWWCLLSSSLIRLILTLSVSVCVTHFNISTVHYSHCSYNLHASETHLVTVHKLDRKLTCMLASLWL